MACILITGGAGYVGSHCAKALAAKGHDGIVFNNLTFGHREFIRWGPLVEGDIRDGAAFDHVFAAYDVEAVIHFAALAYVGESVTAPGRYYDVNVHGTFGISQITLQFDLNRDIDAAAQDVQTAINTSGSTLPRNPPHPPVYSKVNPTDAAMVTLAITSDTISLRALSDIADTLLAQRLSELTGIDGVTVQRNAETAALDAGRRDAHRWRTAQLPASERRS
jgi:nucleoside-diphosphate-sugar epimerase